MPISWGQYATYTMTNALSIGLSLNDCEAGSALCVVLIEGSGGSRQYRIPESGWVKAEAPGGTISNDYRTVIWYKLNIPAGTNSCTVEEYAGPYSSSGKLAIIELRSSNAISFESSSSKASPSGTSHDLADTDELDASAGDLFLIAAASDDYGRTYSNFGSYTKHDLSTQYNLLMSWATTGPLVDHKASVTLNADSSLSGVVLCFKESVTQPSKSVSEHVAYGAF